MPEVDPDGSGKEEGREGIRAGIVEKIERSRRGIRATEVLCTTAHHQGANNLRDKHGIG